MTPEEARARDNLASIIDGIPTAIGTVGRFAGTVEMLQACGHDLYLERALRDEDAAYTVAEETARALDDRLVYECLGTKIHRFERPLRRPAPEGTHSWVSDASDTKPRNFRELNALQERVHGQLLQMTDDAVVTYLDQHAQRVRLRSFAQAVPQVTGRRAWMLFFSRADVAYVPHFPEEFEVARTGRIGRLRDELGAPVNVSVAPRDPIPPRTFYCLADGGVAFDTGRLRVVPNGDNWRFFIHERIRALDASGILRVEVL